MPGYGGQGSATLLRENQQVWLFQQENNLAGFESIAVQLECIRGSFYPWGASLQIYFTDVNGNPAAPGVFEIDLQASDIDQDRQYCLEGTAITTVNANNVARVELGTNFRAKYLRLLVVTLTNPVYVSALLTR